MAFMLVKKVVVAFGGQVGSKMRSFGASKQKDLVEKARAGRYRDVNTEENKCPTHFDSRQALVNELLEKNPGTVNGDYCAICGIRKGNEDTCRFLSPHEPSCARNKLMKEILVQQLRDTKNKK